MPFMGMPGRNVLKFWFLLAPLILSANAYPPEWWAPFPEDQKSSWEILPQDAEPGEVIISKRTPLGVFSNLWATPIFFEGKNYASLEGFWQMLKYPEDAQDPRAQFKDWPYTRHQVHSLVMFEAKKAGDLANEINKKLGIKWISYKGNRFEAKDGAAGSRMHYDLIYRITREKILQNHGLKDLLLQTQGLRLRMDHAIKESEPPSYQTHLILMKIREELLADKE